MMVAGLAALMLLPVSLATPYAAGEEASIVAERLRGASQVVIAKTRAGAPRWLTNSHGDRLIITEFVLEVEETLKGQVMSELTIEVPGGTLDGVTLRVSGQPVFKPGDRAVFMLESTTAGVHKLHRRGEGVLRLNVQNSIAGSALTISDVRQLARAGRK
jgi:hypothetical protein